ncbi:sulfur carrier protein ThiS [Chitinivorax tropicus]|uniref:sulfur carrier protein ThiS n=1 Tax=Chitinivorax tropicus TaxID=714531 RepID=UPI001609923C
MIEVMINGQPRHFAAAVSLTGLLAELDLLGKRVAIERNGEIVPRSQFDALTIASGDSFEIVVAVGGG